MEKYIFVGAVMVALIIGLIIGLGISPKQECDVCKPQEQCVQEPCIQEPCIQETCVPTVIEKECEDIECNCENTCNTNTPNEQLIEDKISESDKKNARVQTVFLTCEEWDDREIEADRLDGVCWQGKRTIIDLVPIRNGNQCKILSVSGC